MRRVGQHFVYRKLINKYCVSVLLFSVYFYTVYIEPTHYRKHEQIITVSIRKGCKRR